MSDEHSGFIMDIKKPTREGEFVACLVITPMLKGGQADVSAKVERNMGRAQCVQVVTDLLKRLGASNDLVTEVEAMSPAKE